MDFPVEVVKLGSVGPGRKMRITAVGYVSVSMFGEQKSVGIVELTTSLARPRRELHSLASPPETRKCVNHFGLKNGEWGELGADEWRWRGFPPETGEGRALLEDWEPDDLEPVELD